MSRGCAKGLSNLLSGEDAVSIAAWNYEGIHTDSAFVPRGWRRAGARKAAGSFCNLRFGSRSRQRFYPPRRRDAGTPNCAGIVEPDGELAARYAARFHLPKELFYSSLEDLLAHTNIQAVAAFTSTFDHRRVVEACAPRGIQVMMEKPLAVNMEHARAIASAARNGGIDVIVNYETTWYPADQAAYAMIHNDRAIGELRKIVVHDGHRGPKEIGCSGGLFEMADQPGPQRRRRASRFRLLRS